MVGAEPPRVLREPVLGLESLVERRARVRREQREERHRDLRLDAELDGALEGVRRVVVEPEDEAAPDRDALVSEPADDLGVLLGLVLALARVADGAVVDRLEADEEGAAASAGHDVDVLHPVKARERRLRDPVLAHRDHRLEELVAVLLVDHHVVVAEQDARPARLELGDDLGNRTEAELRSVVGRDAAELARERASAGGLHDVERDVPHRREQPPPWERHADEGPVVVVLVDGPAHQRPAGAETTCPRVLHHVAPEPLGLAADDRVRVEQSLFRESRDVDAPEDDLAPAHAVRVGDRVGACGSLRVDADPDQVRGVALLREIDRVEAVVADCQLHVVRRVRGERRDPEGLDVRRILVRRCDQMHVEGHAVALA